jgi:carbon-monoxide dehydrogenase medium subunit
VSDTPAVVDLTSALGGELSDTSADAAAELALGQLDPADDLHATAAYRSQLVRVLTARVLRAAYDDALARGSGTGGSGTGGSGTGGSDTGGGSDG